MTSEARAIGGTTHTTGYSYDAAGRMTGMTYPSGRTIAYGLDGLGRISRIETTGGGTTQVVVQDVAYQPFGPAKGFTFGNLLTSTRTFDLDGRIATHSLAAQTKTLSFDAASRITRIEQQGVSTNFADYGYDALDRLTSTVLPTSTFSFGYDAVGNRVSKSIGASSDAYTYPATSNRLAAIAGSSPRSYSPRCERLDHWRRGEDVWLRRTRATRFIDLGRGQCELPGQCARSAGEEDLRARGHGLSLRRAGPAGCRVIAERRPDPGVSLARRSARGGGRLQPGGRRLPGEPGS